MAPTRSKLRITRRKAGTLGSAIQVRCQRVINHRWPGQRLADHRLAVPLLSHGSALLNPAHPVRDHRARAGQRDRMSGSFPMKLRMSSICAAVEMKSKAVELTGVVRPSRMAV